MEVAIALRPAPDMRLVTPQIGHQGAASMISLFSVFPVRRVEHQGRDSKVSKDVDTTVYRNCKRTADPPLRSGDLWVSFAMLIDRTMQSTNTNKAARHSHTTHGCSKYSNWGNLRDKRKVVSNTQVPVFCSNGK